MKSSILLSALLAATSAASLAAELSGTVITAGSNDTYDLPVLGALDWAFWNTGANPAAGTPTGSMAGAALIGDMAPYNGGNLRGSTAPTQPTANFIHADGALAANITGFNTTHEVASIFEPSVAEALFNEFITEAGVTVVTGRLDLADGIVMDGKRIAHLRLEDGREFAGKIFIDCSYEGDLLPGAGVTYTTGREANATYNETVNGIQAARATLNQLPDGIDPYVVPGAPSSGLLPGVNADAGGPDGTADHRFQAYCFRMVLTDVPKNRVMITQPPGYDEADYELLFRAIEAGQDGGFFKLSPVPNRKTDSNNHGGISTDFIGMNYGP